MQPNADGAELPADLIQGLTKILSSLTKVVFYFGDFFHNHRAAS